MTFKEIKEVLLQVILEIQSGSGRPVPEIHDELRPIGDFEGFDSLNAVETACQLSEYLDYEIPNDLLLPTFPGSQLTIDEIVNRLYSIVNT